MTINMSSDERQNVFPWVALGLIIVVLFFLTFKSVILKPGAFSQAQKPTANKVLFQVKVLVSNLKFRKTPEVKADNVVTTLTENTVLNVVEDKGTWFKVKTPGKRLGYISSNQLFTQRISK